jgi:hypothetical protein
VSCSPTVRAHFATDRGAAVPSRSRRRHTHPRAAGTGPDDQCRAAMAPRARVRRSAAGLGRGHHAGARRWGLRRAATDPGAGRGPRARHRGGDRPPRRDRGPTLRGVAAGAGQARRRAAPRRVGPAAPDVVHCSFPRAVDPGGAAGLPQSAHRHGQQGRAARPRRPRAGRRGPDPRRAVGVRARWSSRPAAGAGSTGHGAGSLRPRPAPRPTRQPPRPRRCQRRRQPQDECPRRRATAYG